MSYRASDGLLADRLREMEVRLRAVESGRQVAAEVSTESIILRSRTGQRYRIAAGTNPGTIEIYDVDGVIRRIIKV